MQIMWLDLEMTPPNKALQRTRHLRLGFAKSLRFAQRPGGRVAELGRSLNLIAHPDEC